MSFEYDLFIENFSQISFNSSEVFGNSFPEGDGNKEKPAPKNKFMPFLNFCKKIFSLFIFILFSPFNVLNDNLEAQLTTLFKEKILDSDELAVVEPLDLNIDFINGLAMQNFRPEENEEFLPVIKIRELSQGYCDNNSEFCTDKIDKSHIINKGDLVFSWSGSLQVAFWTSDRAGLNQHLFKVVSATYPQWYVYLWVKHHLLNFQRIAENKGTTFGHIKREDLHSAMIKTVDEYTIASLNKVFSPILSAYLKNAAEVHRLADVQKVLLARLSH